MSVDSINAFTPDVPNEAQGVGAVSPSLSYFQTFESNGQLGGADTYCFKPKLPSAMSVVIVGLFSTYPPHVVAPSRGKQPPRSSESKFKAVSNCFNSAATAVYRAFFLVLFKDATPMAESNDMIDITTSSSISVN